MESPLKYTKLLMRSSWRKHQSHEGPAALVAIAASYQIYRFVPTDRPRFDPHHRIPQMPRIMAACLVPASSYKLQVHTTTCLPQDPTYAWEQESRERTRRIVAGERYTLALASRNKAFSDLTSERKGTASCADSSLQNRP